MKKLNNTQYTINGVTRSIEDTLALCANTVYKLGSFKPGILVWDFGNGDTVHTIYPEYSFSDSGLYTVYSYPTQTSCLSLIQDTLIMTLHVEEICLVTNPEIDTLVCRGQSVKLHAYGTTPQLESCRKYDWYIGNFLIGKRLANRDTL